MTDETLDYVIVGAGSAGCVLANRLSEDPGVTAAVLEAGGRDTNAPTIMIAEKASDMIREDARSRAAA